MILPASIDGGLIASVSLLLIENDQVDEMALTKAVAENALPYQITVARSVAEARQILATRSFDIILTDYSLADGTSFDLMKELAGQVVIFITGSGNEEIAAQALHLGAEDYLIKDPQRNYLKLLPYRVATALQQARMTQELRESEQRFRVMFEQAAVGAAQIDTMTGRFVRVNQKHTNIIGYTVVEMLALDFQSLTYPDDLEADLANMERLKSGEIREFEMEKRLFHEDGRVVWVKLTVSAMWAPGAPPDYHLAIVQDITAHKQAEFDLLHAKENAEYSTAELTDYIEAVGKLALVSVTDRSGRILQANAKFCEISGYSEQELIGQDHRILNSGTHPKAFFTDMWAIIARGEVWHREICNRSKSGQLYWVDSTIVPLKDKAGKVTGYLSVRVDITARKHKELALQERLKESACLHAIRHDMELALPLDELCQNIIAYLRGALQFPQIASGMIELDDKHYTSENYRPELTHGLQAQIMVRGKAHGWLRAFYSEDQPFLLPEEQGLIDIIASDLGRWLERMQAEHRIVEMATHDMLTGLPNRHLLQDRISQALAHDRRSQEQAAVLFIDLDHFKIINDSLGHAVGDALLQEVAERLNATVRGEDTVARQGGDEFIVLLPNIAGALDAQAVAQKILDTLIQPFRINDQELHVGGSIGIALFPLDGEDGDTLLKNSDIAMYHAKESGRNNCQFFAAEMNQLATERHSLGIDLRHTLERHELLLYFQPVIDMPGARLSSMEVLLRWQHPSQGLILPDRFIALAEESGMIVPIGEWVIRQSCLQIKDWQSQGYAVPKLAVNLSARQFRQKTLVADITRILAETGVEGSCLTLEITESELVENVEETIKTLQQLSALGLEISIDDFGTGYSSLSYLKRYPINTLKIDRSFVHDIATDPDDVAIIGAIIAMARSLKMEVLAEGVETEEQLDFLTRHGCNRFQGFYFSRPLPAVEAASRLQMH